MDTETWLRPVAVDELLRMHQGKLNRRKLRLYAVACCLRLEALLTDERSRRAVAVAERFADGVATSVELSAAEAAANDVWNDAAYDETDRWTDVTTDAADFACSCSADGDHEAAESLVQLVAAFHETHRLLADEPAAQLALLRCIYGPNPFRPVAFDPRWRSESAVALARVAYDTRNFSLLPILADALEDAGCDNATALAHLRGPGPHARGCWVVDLVLGK